MGEEVRGGKDSTSSRVICIDEILNRPGNPLSATSTDHTSAPHNAAEQNRPGQSVIYIYDGIRRWWRIRRFQVIAALFLCIGIIIGMVILAVTMAWKAR